MTREQLFEMLDLAPAPSAGSGMDDEGFEPGDKSAGPPPSPTALALDDWSIRRGAESLSGDVMTKALKIEPDDSVTDAQEHAAADFLAAAFEPNPKLADRCVDDTRHRYMGQLLETEEYRALHADTQLDPLASELAAGHFAQGWVALAENEPQGPQGSPGPPGKPGPGQETQKDLAALRAAAEALSEAQKDVDDLRDARRGLGHGPGEGGNVPLAEMKARFERIRNSGRLRRIMALAGRYRRLAQAKQRQKTIHGRDDVVGVELGNDLGRIVPNELASLGDEDLEWDALRRLHERSMMQRDYRGVEAKGQGPIVVVVDESGSMEGDPIATAKAFALAMGWIAKYQRRWIAFVGFAGATEGNFLAMPPAKWDQSALLDWLEHFFNGGTDMDVPLELLPAKWQELGCPPGRTDVIQITDAVVHIPDDMRDRFLAWKAETDARYYTLVVGENNPGPIENISDRVWCVPDLGVDQEAIQEMLAL